jgi:glycosyltransferase involved in cell wall biosynthesis
VVVHPPVDVDRFAPGEPEDFFLCVGELVAHKRTEDAVRAARRAGVPLKVVGTGPEHDRLQATFGGDGSIELLGRVDDRELAALYSRARAFVMPNVEEFGIAAVEAQAAGRPVVAVDAGGAQETVVDGVTGVLVPEGRPDALAEALRDVDFDRFDAEQVVRNARRFATPVFQERLRAEVDTAWRER